MAKKKNELEFESDKVKAYVQQIQAENGILKQECEKWKNAYEVKEDALEEAEEYTEELEEKYHKAQEQLDQLKEQLETYKMEAEEGKEINAELKAENERLKKEIRLYDCIEKWGTEQCHCACRCLGNEFCKDADKKINKLKQTLTEIKDIAEELLQTKIPFCEIYGRIIDKISEVEDEHNG